MEESEKPCLPSNLTRSRQGLLLVHLHPKNCVLIISLLYLVCADMNQIILHLRNNWIKTSPNKTNITMQQQLSYCTEGHLDLRGWRFIGKNYLTTYGWTHFSSSTAGKNLTKLVLGTGLVPRVQFLTTREATSERTKSQRLPTGIQQPVHELH